MLYLWLSCYQTSLVTISQLGSGTPNCGLTLCHRCHCVHIIQPHFISLLSHCAHLIPSQRDKIQCRLEEEGEGSEGTYRAGETEQEGELQTKRARESGRSRERGRDREGYILMYAALCSVHYIGNCYVLFEFTKKLHLETGLHPSLGLNFFMPSVL